MWFDTLTTLRRPEGRIINFIDLSACAAQAGQPDVIKKILQHQGLWEEAHAPPVRDPAAKEITFEVSLKVEPSILSTAYHLEVDLRPFYRAVNLIKRLSTPKTFDLLDRVSFTTLKCHQEAGSLNHPHLLYQRFPSFPDNSSIDFFSSLAHRSPTNRIGTGGFYSMLISVSNRDYSPYFNPGPTSMPTRLSCYFLAFLKKSR